MASTIRRTSSGVIDAERPSGEHRQEVLAQDDFVPGLGRGPLVAGPLHVVGGPASERDPAQSGIAPLAPFHVGLHPGEEPAGVALGGEGVRERRAPARSRRGTAPASARMEGGGSFRTACACSWLTPPRISVAVPASTGTREASIHASISSGSKRRRCPHFRYGMRFSVTRRRTWRTPTGQSLGNCFDVHQRWPGVPDSGRRLPQSSWAFYVPPLTVSLLTPMRVTPMRVRHPEADMTAKIFFEHVVHRVGHLRAGHGTTIGGPGTGNATQIPRLSIMRLGIPGHLPGLVPKPFPIRRKSQGAIPETCSHVPDQDPGRSRIRATCPVPGSDGHGKQGHGSARSNPDPRSHRPTNENLTANDHHYP